jgi:hypothetical protein
VFHSEWIVRRFKQVIMQVRARQGPDINIVRFPQLRFPPVGLRRGIKPGSSIFGQQPDKVDGILVHHSTNSRVPA